MGGFYLHDSAVANNTSLLALLLMPFVPGMKEDGMLNAYWLLSPIAVGTILLVVLGLIDTCKGRFVMVRDKIYSKSVFINRKLLI